MRVRFAILFAPLLMWAPEEGRLHAEGAMKPAPSVAQGPLLERHAENTYRPRQELLRRGPGLNHGFSFMPTEESLAEATFTRRGADLLG